MKYDIIFLFTDKKKLNRIWLQKILCTLLLRTLVILSFVLYIYIYDVRFLTQMSLYLSLFLPLMQIQCQICELFLLHLCLFQLLLYKYLQLLKNLAAQKVIQYKTNDWSQLENRFKIKIIKYKRN